MGRLLQRRVAYAERLILETDYTVDYIAELACLQTPLRLYRAFKKYGKPPARRNAQAAGVAETVIGRGLVYHLPQRHSRWRR